MWNLSQSTRLPGSHRWNLSLLSTLWRAEKLRSADRQCALAGGQAGLLSGTGKPGPEWVR